ncbi:MAG: hypothetical protein Q7Q73_06300 [Verrucomicrobiota bacterium JB024]|nr:hypothetical protein [Verrucomicrobiota bacterium JB024]
MKTLRPYLNTLIAASGLTLLGAVTSQAAIVADFTGGIGTSSATTQFVGTSGDGWTTAWQTSTTESSLTPAIDSNDHLNVSLTSTAAVAQHRTSINRGYDVNALPATYTISFTITANDLTGMGADDFIGIFSAQNAQVAATSTSVQTWGILITGSSGSISFRDGEDAAHSGTGTSNINTGLTFTEGNSYSFEITVDSANRKWDATISSGSDSFTSEGMNFRSETAISQYIMFNTLMNKDNSPNETWSYTLDGVTIVPEASSTALYLLVGVSLALPFLRRRFRPRAA